jgi:hypothetical protein
MSTALRPFGVRASGLREVEDAAEHPGQLGGQRDEVSNSVEHLDHGRVLMDPPSVKSFNGVRAVCVPVASPVAVSRLHVRTVYRRAADATPCCCSITGGNNHDVSSY